MRNIKLTIEYDGTDFCGYQIQKNERTVQSELQRSLSMLTGETVRLIAAGRTDSGVHATGQVVNLKTESTLHLEAFLKGGNTRLPKDIRIIKVEQVPLDFSARYSAKRRTYRYYISKSRKAIGRQYAWSYWNPLDLKKMRAACKEILGVGDFQSFCQAKADVDHYLCDVRFAYWREVQDHFIFDICANRFLHNMVRTLVGTMVEIGDMRRQQSINMAEVLRSKDRSAAGPTAPAHGLFLLRVDY